MSPSAGCSATATPHPIATEGVRHASSARRKRRTTGHQGRAVARRSGPIPRSRRTTSITTSRSCAKCWARRPPARRSSRRCRASVTASCAVEVEGAPPRTRPAAARQHPAGDPLLHDGRRRPPRVCDERQRPAARQGVELAHPPRLRMGEPDLAALVGSAVAASPGDPLRRARQRHVSARCDGRELRHVGAGSGDCRRCAQLDRFALLGISRGASIAIAYAVKHPERVSQLVLYGGFATGLNTQRTGVGAGGAPCVYQPDRALAGV